MKCLHRIIVCGVLCGVITAGCSKPAEEKTNATEQSPSPEASVRPGGTQTSQAADADPEVSARLDKIYSLSTSGKPGDETVDALIVHLDDSSPMVRAHAARALGLLGESAKAAVSQLTKLVQDPDEKVRRQAIEALVAIQPGTLAPLTVELMKDPDPGVRMRILHAATDAGASAVPSMIEALQDKESEYWACLVLREIGPKAASAVPALTRKLQHDDEQVQRAALLALAAIGEGAKPAVPQIVKLLDDESLRTAATFALGSIDDIPPDAEATIKSHAESDDPFHATVSLWALARLHPEDTELRREATTQLVARLKDEDPFVRAAASRALIALPPAPEITLAALEKGLKGADATTVHHALDSLAALGEPAVPRLIEALKHKALQGQVAYILGQIGPAAAPATDELVKLMHNKDFNLSSEAVHALANIGPGAKAAVPELIKELEIQDSPLRFSVAFALGKIGPDAVAAEPALLNTTKDADPSLSVLGGWAILQIDGATEETAAKVLPVLIAGLDAPLPQTRRTAAEALETLGPLAAGATERLKQLQKEDEDEKTRSAAAKALQAISF